MTVIDDSTPVLLRGNGRPVTEERTITDLPVTGSTPGGARRPVRPQRRQPAHGGTADHPFFGDGMVHGVRLRDGKAEWYRNRYVQTPFIADPVDRHPRSGGGDRHDGLEGQHPRDRPRRQDPRPRGGPLAVRARRRARARSARPTSAVRSRARSPPIRRSARSPASCSPSGTRAFEPVPALPPGLGRRRAGADRGHHRQRPDDDARLQHHAEPRDLHGPAGRVRPRAWRCAARCRSTGTTTTRPASA